MGAMSVNRKFINSAEMRVILILGVGTVASATASKFVHKVAINVLEEYGKLKVSLVIFATVTVVLDAYLQQEIRSIAITLGGLCVSYVVCSLLELFVGKKGTGTTLPSFMTDMIAEAKIKAEREAKLHPGKTYVPLIGYEGAIEQMKVQMLTEEATNAKLIGRAGVGKSCIWERIIDDIVHSDKTHSYADPFFADFRFIHISVNSLLAGTGYRGTLEERIKVMLKIAKENPRIIYVMDEIHLLVKAEGFKGTDIAGTLYEALARGEIRIWGATTPELYERFIMFTPLDRRLPTVNIDEPNPMICYKMLRQRYSDEAMKHLRFKVSPEAIGAAIIFSLRDIPEHALPDKAVAEIQYAIAAARLKNPKPDHDVIIGVKEIAAAHLVKVVNRRTKAGLTLDNLQSAYRDMVGRLGTFFSSSL